MRMTHERGYSTIILMMVGLLLLILLAGYFTYSKSSKKSLLPRTPGVETTTPSTTTQATTSANCGIVLNSPSKNQTIRFPINLSGKVNGCGWKATTTSVGSAYIQSSRGTQLTDTIILHPILSGNDTETYFEGILTSYSVAPDTAYGTLVITSATTPTKTFKRQINLAGSRIAYGVCGINVSAPSINTRVVSPLKIYGRATGCDWRAEQGTFGSVALFADNGTQITGFQPLMQQATYEGNTSFSAELVFPPSDGTSLGYLLFQKPNATLGDQLKEYRVPIIF